MALTSKPSDGEIRHYRCDCCRLPVDRVWNWVHRDGVGRAMYFANCYHHVPRKVVLDVVLGTWTQYDHPDHVTFGCRVDLLDGRPVPTLVDPLYGRSGAPVDGQVISAQAALTHPLLPEFWEFVDFILLTDPTVHPHLR